MPNLGNFRFRSKPETSADKESAYERRRSQVRRAQRNHRERKENYIKALEAEVVKLRKHSQEDFRDIGLLKLTLQQYNIPIPDLESAHRPADSELENAGPIASPEKPSLTIKRPGKNKPLQIDGVYLGNGEDSAEARRALAATSQRPSPAFTNDASAPSDRSSPLNVVGSGGRTSPVAAMQSMNISGQAQDPLQPLPNRRGAPDFSFDTSGRQRSSFQGGFDGNRTGLQSQNRPVPLSTPSDLDSSVIGMEFVLALEHPCMGHIDMVREPHSTHSHMVSRQLLDHAPASVNDTNTSLSLWSVPIGEAGGPENANAGIEKLLELSGTFELQGEITPVQAWFRVKNDPRFRLLQESVTAEQQGPGGSRAALGTAAALQRLERLRQVLWGDVKCYGFGAVMDEQIFEIGVEEALGGIGAP